MRILWSPSIGQAVYSHPKLKCFKAFFTYCWIYQFPDVHSLVIAIDVNILDLFCHQSSFRKKTVHRKLLRINYLESCVPIIELIESMLERRLLCWSRESESIVDRLCRQDWSISNTRLNLCRTNDFFIIRIIFVFESYISCIEHFLIIFLPYSLLCSSLLQELLIYISWQIRN